MVHHFLLSYLVIIASIEQRYQYNTNIDAIDALLVISNRASILVLILDVVFEYLRSLDVREPY